ncbi:MAG: hypothetical protein ABFD11_08410 [Christensenella sp.]
MVRAKTCLLRIDFHPLLQADSLRYRNSDGYVKKTVLDFILGLYARGYRHFVIYINKPSDLWIAEMVYFLSLSNTDLGLCYSIGLWLDTECNYVWMDRSEIFIKEVIEHAKRVFWRSKKWYDNYYRLERLYIELIWKA